MHVIIYVLLVATSALADESEDRRSKLPYIADAVGNSLPPPSSVPATVGSPVNLLTPDRYEFYTFDESGELVKRLMTLEEIQAIVAAGEETEGLVTFANDNQPTTAFNFSQPSHTKVHSVVTNVQNVLKAQMEAQKNKPNVRPTLDTPDVSDSWSLILPSIFGNSGIDIVPDKNAETYITPETETIEIENTESKENVPQANIIPEKVGETSKTTTTTTTNKPVSTTKKLYTTTTPKLITTTSKSTPISTTWKVTTTLSTTSRPTSTSTKRPVISSTIKNKPLKLTIPQTTPKLGTTATENINDNFTSNISVNTHTISLSNLNPQLEKLSTFIPHTTAAYSIEKTPVKIDTISKSTTVVSTSNNSTKTSFSTTPLPLTSSSTSNISYQILTNSLSNITPLKTVDELEKNSSTTMTTQSISPSTSLTATETTPTKEIFEKNQEDLGENDKNSEPILPLFDVAQSISQIASDLGGGYSPGPTTTNIQDAGKINNLPLESKENLDIDIPPDPTTDNDTNSTFENFIKISTFDPEEPNKKEVTSTDETTNSVKDSIKITTQTPVYSTSVHSTLVHATTIALPANSVIDPILSESIGDMLSQVINQSYPTATVPERNTFEEDITTTAPRLTTPRLTTPKLTTSKLTTPKLTTPKLTTPRLTTSQSTTARPFTTVNTKEFLETSTNSQLLTTKKEENYDIIKQLSEKKQNFTVSTTTNKNLITDNVLQFFVNKNINSNMKTNKTKPSLNSLSTYNINHSIKNDLSYKNSMHESTIHPMKSELFNWNKLVNKVETTTKADLITEVGAKKPSITQNEENTTNASQNKNKPLDEFKKKIQKVNIDDKEMVNERNNSWKLIPTVPLPKFNETEKNTQKPESFHVSENNVDKHIVLDYSKENQGLEVTTKDLGEDLLQFTELCNELAFRYWNEVNKSVDNKRSFVLSPYSITSMLAMMFMGAKGATSGEMNDILKLDDMVTFNPHFTLKNISDSIETSSSSGVAISAFIRELYSDRSKGKVLTFYKERAQHFYNGHVEEINFKLISDIIRRRTNLLVKRYTWGKIPEYMKSNSIFMHPPLAAFSANIFETDCTGSSVEGRDGEMYFVVSPTVRQRRLVPVPAVVYKSNFLAGYDSELDATAAALGNTNSIISTLFLMPGQQGNVAHAEDLVALEKRLLSSVSTTHTWQRLLRTLLPRVGLQLQIPRFSHKSTFNVSSTLKNMGLKELFDAAHADLGGLNGPSKELYLSDMIQLSTFVTCGEGLIGEQHHIEEYPEVPQSRRRNSRWATMWDEPRDYQRAFHDPHDVGDAMNLPLHLRPRQARLPTRSTQPARLKFDRPFLFFVRHNPSGMILYVGRYNPRLLP